MSGFWFETGGGRRPLAADFSKHPCDGCQRDGCPEICPYVPNRDGDER